MPPPANLNNPTILQPKGLLTFKATRTVDADREVFIGLMPVFNLIDQGFVAPVASDGLAPEILRLSRTSNGTGPVQRKTNPAHVQDIVDYIVKQAETGEPWAFNSLVLYSTNELAFETTAVGVNGAAGEAQANEAFSVGEGLHRCLAWAVALGQAKVRGVRRPVMSIAAEKRIERATIPVIIVVEPDLHRQKTDFHMLNKQKPLSATVLALTDDAALSDLTRSVIGDVKLFDQRIDLNSASVGAKSDKLLSFSQLRFGVASYLLGRKTRSPKINEQAVEEIIAKRGRGKVRAELKEVFTEIATRFGGLERLHLDRTHSPEMGDHVRKLRADTLLTGSATWRALLVALHDAKDKGVDAATAMDRIKESKISWQRDSEFFAGSLLEIDPETKELTGKLLHSRESIDNAAAKLWAIMIGDSVSSVAA